MLKLNLQHFGHLTRRTDSLEKTLMLGKIEGRRRRGWGWDGWMASRMQLTLMWAISGSWWWTGGPGVLQSMGSQSRTWLSDWTELNENDWGKEEKGETEDEMVGWHHWFNGHEFEQTSGDSEGQGSLACCSAWGRKVSDATEWLNTNNENDGHFFSSISLIYFS